MERVQVVLRSVVTWSAIVTGIAATIVSNPELFPDEVVRYAAIVVSVGAAVASVVASIRRVTPVGPDERGLLPKDSQA